MEHRKRINSVKDPERITPSGKVYIPLNAWLEEEREREPSCTIIGQELRKGEIIVSPNGMRGYASVSGELEEFVTEEHPLMGTQSYAVLRCLQNRGNERRKRELNSSYSAKKLINAARAAGIIDEYDGLPLYQKLELFQKHHIKTLVANAVDDEPYVSSGIATVLHYGDFVMEAFRLVKQLFPHCDGYLIIFAPHSIHGVSKIPSHWDDVLVKKVCGKYPLWIELDKILADNKEAVGKIGVQALLSLYRYLCYGEVQTEQLITLDGDSIDYCGNFWVPIGTSLNDLLKVGGIREKTNYIVMGDPINGKTILNTDVPLIFGTRSIVAFSSERQREKKKYPCLGCGRCNAVCPKGLYPGVIAKRLERGQAKNLANYHIDRCIGCGSCSIACPAGRELTKMMRSLKNGEDRSQISL